MDTDHLLNNLAYTFNISSHHQSQDLLKKIITLASKKLSSSKNFKDLSSQNSSHSIKFVKEIFGQKTNVPKRKFISKAKLRQIALRKIAQRNKKIHLKFIQTTHFKKLTIDNQRIQIINNPDLQFEAEQHKLQSHGEESENSPLCSNEQKYPQNRSISKKQKADQQVKFYQKNVSEKFQKIRKNFENYLKSQHKDSKTDDVICPICIETLIDPVSTICGHSFCFRCLDQSLLFGSNCPVCRLQIKGSEIVPCASLKNFIWAKCHQSQKNEQAIENYQLRKEQNKQWKHSRFLNPSELKEGDLLDVRDTENIWCKATVLKIYSVNGKVSSVLIHYLQWAKIYDEIIEINSIRLAPKDYFSTRTDIPRYNLGSGEENLRGAVITGNSNQGILRNNNEDLTFSNILQLGSQLRNRMFSLQNNVINQLAAPSQNRVSFLHHVIPDNNDSEQPINEILYRNGLNDEESESSLGSFAFGAVQGNQFYQYSDSQSEHLSDFQEIGQPYQQSFLSIRENFQQQEDNDEDEYWNAHPGHFQEQQANEPMQDPGLNIPSFSPMYRQNTFDQNYQQVNFDEDSYVENSYSQ